MSRDPSMEQTAAGLSTTRGFLSDLTFDSQDIEILRDLAKRVAELADRPIEIKKAKLWTKHNDLNYTRPLVFIDPENGWNEIIPQNTIKCRQALFRVWEMALRKEIYWAERLRDDRVIEPYFDVPYNYEDSGWGLTEEIIQVHQQGSYTWDPPIKNYDEDFPKLQYPQITIDYEKTEKVLNTAREIFDDILEVRLRGVWWWTLGMTWDYISLRGLENFMFDMYDNPEWVHRMMSFLKSGIIRKLKYLENNKLLALNTEGTYVGSGGFGWTDELPQDDFNKDQIRISDMWGFAESQETVGVSTEMFTEFIFPYQKEILDHFGLNCYGCCEPIDPRWEVVKKIKNLRRVSVSPWADKNKMSEYLGENYIYSLKPSPAPLAKSVLDEEMIRNEIREILKITKNNIVEVIMKDNHTLGNNPKNAVRWVQIVKEEIKKAGY